MKSNPHLKRTVIAYLACFAAIQGTSASAWAISQAGEGNEPLFSLPQLSGKDSLSRLRDAVEALENDPGIRELSGKSEIHAFSIQNRITSGDLETTRFQHYFKGLEVVGSQVMHHLGKNGSEVQKRVFRFDVDTLPKLSADEAVSIAKAEVGDRALESAPELKILPSIREDRASLVYWIYLEGTSTDSGRELIIDAHSGRIIANLSTHLEIAPIQVFSAQGQGVSIDTSTLPSSGRIDPSLAKQCQVLDSSDGRPLMVNPVACKRVVLNNQVSADADSSAKNAARNTTVVLNYYLSKHQRNSFNGKGASATSVVHVGTGFNNAFWETRKGYMAYGDGDGQTFGDFSQALDVAGHEMTHGVVSATAQLLMMDEAGALNEAIADFFGKMIENKGSWRMGSEIFKAPGAGKAIRDLANPGSLKASYRDDLGNRKAMPYPATLREKLSTSATCGQNNDRCYVHLNSTIPSHASYLVHQAIGKEKTEKLMYAVLTQYLSAQSDFADMAASARRACKALFDSATCSKVDDAYRQVGL